MKHSDEFVKFSFHNHFGGDAAERPIKTSSFSYSFDLEQAKSVIDDAASNGFEILGFTNHNIFVKGDFINLRDYAKEKGILLLPGAELDLVNNITLSETDRKFLHTTIVFTPNVDLEKLQKTIDEFVNKNNEYCITNEQIAELVLLDKCIVCPHGYKQKNRSASQNVDQFLEIMGMATLIPIFIEDSKEISKLYLSKKLINDLSAFEYEYLKDYIGSISCADRLSFDKIKEPTYL